MLYKVSVIIPVYNGSEFLKQAVESVLNQTYKNVEVVVVNDGSNDHGLTRDIALSFGEKICYYEKENGGVASALNFGIRMMTGDFFVWLSHDDLMEHNKIEKQINAIKETGNIDNISISNYEFFQEKTQLRVQTLFEKYYEVEEIENSLFLLIWEELHFSSLLFHRHHFEKVGVFDETLKTAQDNEFMFRLLRGQKLVFVDEVLSRVRIHSRSGTNTKKIIVKEENCKLYYDILYQLSDVEKCKLAGTVKCVDDKIQGIIKSMGGIVQEYTDLEQINIIIFGAGVYGRRFNYELNANGKKPLCFVDNDPLKDGCIIDGVECRYLPSMILNNDCEIVVAQKFYEPAVQQLKKLNITNYCIKEEYDEVEK